MMKQSTTTQPQGFGDSKIDQIIIAFLKAGGVSPNSYKPYPKQCDEMRAVLTGVINSKAAS